MAVDYSVECALPYHEDLEPERERFSVALSGLAKHIEEKGNSYSRVLLVDDVTNEAGSDYDLDSYTEASRDGKDTLVMRESMLQGLSDSVYADMETRFPVDELAKFKNEKGYSSPFYIAVWTLVRLGYLSHSNFPQEQVSVRVANVLPESFRRGEEESLEIVRKTQFPQAAEQVEYVFVNDDVEQPGTGA